MDDANREMNFTILLTEQERLGKRVESRTDYAAVLAKGEPVNHALRLPVTILTLGLWGLVWLWLVRNRGESRELMEIDVQGFTKRTPI